MRDRIARGLAAASGVLGSVAAIGWWSNLDHTVVHGTGSAALALLAFSLAVHR